MASTRTVRRRLVHGHEDANGDGHDEKEEDMTKTSNAERERLTDRLRPRRLKPPYASYDAETLRDECVRRGVAVANEATRTRGCHATLVDALRQADVLEHYEKQRTARARRASARSDLDLDLDPDMETNTTTSKRRSKRRLSQRQDSDIAEKDTKNHGIRVHVGRACRFRLINVLVSPKFRTRWGEMGIDGRVTRSTPCNGFWDDVQKAFVSDHARYGRLLFRDELFAGVDASQIDELSARKLWRIWKETVVLYKAAIVAQRQARHSTRQDRSDQFSSRYVDLVYLHKVTESFRELGEMLLDGPESDGEDPTSSVVAPLLTGVTPSVKEQRRPKFVKLQHPEMLPDWLIEDQAKVDAARELSDGLGEEDQAKVDAARGEASDGLVEVGAEGEAARFDSDTEVLGDDSVESSSSEESLPADENDENAAAKSNISSDLEDLGEDIDEHSKPKPLVETTLVRSSHNRVQTSSVTTTTTLTRTHQDTIVPSDEFDILEVRLRRMNENIAECFRTLSGEKGVLNELHRQDVENDLRFYSAVKKHIQQQMVMTLQNS